jgi:hypothetical protein
LEKLKKNKTAIIKFNFNKQLIVFGLELTFLMGLGL